MAGSLYLGSQRVCPAIVTGGGGGNKEFAPYQIVNGVAEPLNHVLTGDEFSNITSVANSGLAEIFMYCDGLIGNLNLSSITSIGEYGLSSCFYLCKGITSVDFSSLSNVYGYGLQQAFYGCSELKTVNFTSLTTLDGRSFNGTFASCTKLEDVYFNSLTTESFGVYTNQFGNMLARTGTTVTHTLHFPSNLESIIQGLDGYPNFGGTSGYVVLAFDLPATS